MKYKRLKPRRSKFKDNKLALLLVLLMSIGIGYASLTTTLSINGTTNVATNSWNIYFANLQINNGSVAGNPDATLSGNSMSIIYGGELVHPGDYYEFTVDVVNEGSLPGKVSIVGLTGNNTEYLSTSYTYSNGKPINLGDILNAGKSKKLTIKAWIPEDIDTSLLPTSDTPITLTFHLQYIQSEEDGPPDATEQIIALAANNSCIEKYEGQVTDSVGVTKTAENVYFNKCADKRNFIFNNMCWQMIRTTETGGIKMIYNGEPDVNGKCLNNRGYHQGIYSANSTRIKLEGELLYGSSFTYDYSTGNFSLLDTKSGILDNSTYADILGNYTCLSGNTTCSNLYSIDGGFAGNYTYSSIYSLTTVPFFSIGKSPYNGNQKSLSTIGYMFNKEYDSRSKMVGSSSYKFGSSFTYDSNSGIYTLNGTIQDISNWSTGYNSINNTHYTCMNNMDTCEKIKYVYFTSSEYISYIELTDGININDAINDMIFDENVNVYSSNAKRIIDIWFRDNFADKVDLLEDVVFCNARNISNYGGWNPNGGDNSVKLQFKNNSSNTDLTCMNITDQFAVSNNNAKLIYPVSMITSEEANNLNETMLEGDGYEWWTISPKLFNDDEPFINKISTRGFVNLYGTPNNSLGLRPVISLSSENVIDSGSGSETDPWIIEE